MEIDQPLELDVEAYAAGYTSHARTDRLLFISDKAGQTQLQLDALRLAAAELKKTENATRYLEVVERLNKRAPGCHPFDREWVDRVCQRSAQRHAQLESELAGYRTNLIKESIRMGYTDIGDQCYNTGDLANAFKYYSRSRDYCTTSKHIVNMCLSVIKVSIEQGNYVHVNNYVQKAEQTPDVQKDPVISGKLKCAAGLAALDNRKYKLAARKFTEANAEMGGQYSDVLSGQDVALYGGLCALASFDRSELKRCVIDNIQFREYLELYPAVREVVNDFYSSKYASCLMRLDRLAPLLQLDLHVHDHQAALLTAIRNKALIQYTVPFTSVDLRVMAAAFNTDVAGLEAELAGLIQVDQVAARIDSAAKVLIARHANQRRATFHWALQTAEDYLRDTRALLLRANLMQHDFMQRAPPGPSGRGGRQQMSPFGDHMMLRGAA